MFLEELEIPTKKINILNKKGIYTVEQLLSRVPNHHFDFRINRPLELNETILRYIEEKEPVSVIGTMLSLESDYKKSKGLSITKIKIIDKITGKKLHVNYIGNYQLCQTYKKYIGKQVMVGGVLQYSEDYCSFSMLNPYILTTDIKKYSIILPVYPKIKGISEDGYKELIELCLCKLSHDDYMPEYLRHQYHLTDLRQSLIDLHLAESFENIKQAEKRLLFDDVLYFCAKLEKNNKDAKSDSDFILSRTEKVDEFIAKQPFSLTDSQNNCLNDIFSDSAKGRRISALVQGDVGSGKTIIAMCLMISAASLGYQSVLMAPTQVLASQHYAELSKWAVERYRCAYLSTDLTAKEKREILNGIKNGDFQFIVGTHSCISKDVEYNNLALAITDEEHKFGVLQRETLKEKGKSLHNITMSATPIPRTLATTIYGENTKVYTIALPSIRKPVKTQCYNNQIGIFKFLEKEIAHGYQGYVVCPLIDEADEGSSMEGIKSVEETFDMYNKYFLPKGIRCGVITGKTTKEEQQDIINEYKNNNISILIATTVIEVGVNNPNATVIVISGAERFGLATLHQLRGRVGRGSTQSYCILQKTNPNIESRNVDILCSTNDGFEIAKADMVNRGIGNIIGIEQSGQSKYMEIMQNYPNLFAKVQNDIVKELFNKGKGEEYIQGYEERYIPETSRI